MPMMTWELWLARSIVQDRPLPWQKSLIHLTPGRVAQGMAGVLAVMVHLPVLPNAVESLLAGLGDNQGHLVLVIPSLKRLLSN
jgi:hypothetical protein